MAGKKGMKRRTKAEIEAVRGAAREELVRSHPATIRRIHYRLVSRADVSHPNTQNAYDTLSRWLRDDRLYGFPVGDDGEMRAIPWEWIVDGLREPRSVPAWQDVGDFIADVGESYHRDVWQDQPHYVEVWCEKDADAYIFERALAPYRVTLNVGRGYDSWTALKKVANRFAEHEPDGASLWCFGDFDPSGEDMVRSLRDRLGKLGCEPEIVQLAVLPEDIERFELPPDFTKVTDSRAPAHVARHGDVAVELDALPEDELERRVTAAVEERMDLDALALTYEQERADAERLAAYLDAFGGEPGRA